MKHLLCSRGTNFTINFISEIHVALFYLLLLMLSGFLLFVIYI